VHGVITGVTGETEANGLWVATPVDANTFSLTTFLADGTLVQSVGTNAYTGGGTLAFAFPDWSILLGRRAMAYGSAVASPRIVFVPTEEPGGYSFKPYVGQPVATGVPPTMGTLEMQNMKTMPQAATEMMTFEVYVTGAAEPPSPDFGDFDATQLLAWVLFNATWDACGGGVRVLHVSWPSQLDPRRVGATGTQTQRGQQQRLIYQFQQPIVRAPLSYVPTGTSLQLTVEPVDPSGSGDQTVITILPEP
jgi:hypothetical protein